MRPISGVAVKFAVFVVVMTTLTATLFVVFGQYRSGSTQGYSAVFADVSSLKAGDSVRIAGIPVGTVTDVDLQPDTTVIVHFDTDREVALTSGTTVAVRYLNLVGDRFLELQNRPAPSTIMPAGARIDLTRTEPALDLDMLLGGLKPVIRGLNPDQVNELTRSLIEIFQGQGGELESLFTKTSSFANSLADNGQTVQQLLDNLREVMATIDAGSEQFGDAIDLLDRLVTGLAADRDPIGEAIGSLEDGTAALSDLLGQARTPLAGTIDQIHRMAPLLANDDDLARLDLALQKAPANYRKLVRLGAYGSWLNQYLCGMSFRVSDQQGRTAVFPWVRQDTGRCAEP